MLDKRAGKAGDYGARLGNAANELSATVFVCSHKLAEVLNIMLLRLYQRNKAQEQFGSTLYGSRTSVGGQQIVDGLLQFVCQVVNTGR